MSASVPMSAPLDEAVRIVVAIHRSTTAVLDRASLREDK